MAIVNESIMEILRESMLRKYIQQGTVVDVKPVKIRDTPDEVIEIKFNGVSVYCRRNQFSIRKLSSYTGFLGTQVPFIVKEVDRENGLVVVSRIEALPIIQNRFLKNVQIGDVMRGTVTGILHEHNIVFVEMDGYPCMIPPGQWDGVPVSDLREVVAIGSEVDCKILSIEKVDESEKNVDVEYRIRVSRRDVLKDEKAMIWDVIENHHAKGDNVLGKIVGKTKAPNQYLIELASSGIVILGNLQAPLSQQFKYDLPQGLKVQAEIISLDKEKRQGKARIFRIDPTLQATVGRGGF
jgi:ribosomal protein S1